MTRLSLSLLGPFDATYDDRPLTSFRSNRVQALLVYLVIAHANSPELAHSREALMELLWPGMSESSARQNLRQTIYLLRQAIPEVTAGNDQASVPFLLSELEVQEQWMAIGI